MLSSKQGPQTGKGRGVKVLITGGAGFIGSHLSEAYLKRGDEVYVIDNLSTGSLDNLKSFSQNPQFKDHLSLTVDTILNPSVLLELVGTCDLVIHLAAAVGVQYIIDNPLEGMITNVRGTDFVLELCNRFKKKVLLTSTSEVYGKHDHAPLLETDDCVYGSSEKFRWSYAAAKLMDEFVGLAYYRTKKLPVMIVRLFNVIGPRQTGRYGMVVPRFIQQALKGEPLTVYGDGSQTRTFTHVKEVVELLIRLTETPGSIGQIVNMGGVEEVSILELAQRVKKLCHSKSEIRLIPYDKAFPKDFEDMQRRVPSTEKLERIVGSAPVMGLDAILKDIIESMKNA